MALTTINSSGIKDDSLVNADIKSDAAIAKSKLASLDIVNADINASAAIAKSKLASLSITNADIDANAAIAFSKLASLPAELTGSTNNTICTVTGANAIQGEANLTFDGTDLVVNGAGDKAIRWATGGTNKWSIYHNNGAGALVAFDNANNQERLRITSTGKVGIGVTPKSWHSNNKAVIQGDGGYSILGRSDNFLGIYQNFYYDASDAGKHIETGEASAYFQNDGNHIFYTAASGSGDAAASLSEVLKLQADKNVKITDGDLQIGTSGHGIDFSATSDSAGKTSELLADYEEGTWTPHDDSGEGLTLAVVEAVYTRIGRLVIARAEKVTYPSTSNNSGARIGGLPFTVGAAHGSGAAPVSSNAYAQRTLANDGTNYIWVYAHETEGGSTNANLSGANIYGICIIYEAS